LSGWKRIRWFAGPEVHRGCSAHGPESRWELAPQWRFLPPQLGDTAGLLPLPNLLDFAKCGCWMQNFQQNLPAEGMPSDSHASSGHLQKVKTTPFGLLNTPGCHLFCAKLATPSRGRETESNQLSFFFSYDLEIASTRWSTGNNSASSSPVFASMVWSSTPKIASLASAPSNFWAT
jgi:hypothetical protein